LILEDGIETIGQYSFYGCTSLKNVTIPGSVRKIESYAFESDGLESVTFEYGIETIGERAFYFCKSLTSVTLPESLITIEKEAFSCCYALTYLKIPDSVTTIGEGAFSRCTNLETLVLGRGVETIGNEAFNYCSNLRTVVMHVGVKSVGNSAFYFQGIMTNVCKVYYGGTSTQFDEISFGSDNGVVTSSVRYYYSETKPSTSGRWWHYDENGEVAIWQDSD
jgi:hypothetical protein